MLKLVQVDSFYGRSHVLHGVNLDVGSGEITTILGRNGTGKTTLLKTIMGLTDQATGEINFEGKNITAAADVSARARAALPMCRRGARSFLTSPSATTSCSAPSRAPTVAARCPKLVPELFPYLIEQSRSPRRRPVRRTAAAARDRARARRRAKNPAARRTDRRHSAVDRRGNRGGHFAPQPCRASHGAAG